jgi:hypothetical protein
VTENLRGPAGDVNKLLENYMPWQFPFYDNRNYLSEYFKRRKMQASWVLIRQGNRIWGREGDQKQ